MKTKQKINVRGIPVPRTKKYIKYQILLLLFVMILFVFAKNVVASEQGILVNEIMYDPRGTDTGQSDWVELYNSTDSAVVIGKSTFGLIDETEEHDPLTGKLKNTCHTMPDAAVTIDPNGYIIVADSKTGFSAAYPSYTGKLIDSTIELLSGGDTLKVSLDRCKTWTADISFVNTWGGKNNGKTLELIDTDGGYGHDNWQESFIDGGTPGAENSKYIPPEPEPVPEPKDEPEEKICTGDIYLNKIFPFKEESVELLNKGSEKCSLKGWSITDSTGYDPEDENLKGKNWSYHRNQFSSDQIIDSGGHAYFRGNLYLNDTYDIVKLFNAEKIKVQSVSYEDAGKHKGFAYIFNNDEWSWDKIDVPHPSVKIVAVNANPQGSDTEFESLTISNNSKKKINLNGWSIATGWKTLYNHPITTDFTIKPGKEKEITREFSKFTLNNTKTKIELRYPDGKVAYKLQYKKKKGSIAEGEIYQKGKKGWKWEEILKPVTQNPEPEIQNSEPETQNLKPGIQNSEPETHNPEPEIQNPEPNKVVEIPQVEIQKQPLPKKRIVWLDVQPIANIELADTQPQVFGEENVMEIDGSYHFTPCYTEPDHYAIVFLKGISSNINLKTNLLLNYFLN